MIQFEITIDANQRFSAVLNGKRVTFDLWYAQALDRWSFDMSIDDEPVLSGRRVVLGVDLLEAFDFQIGAIFAHTSLPVLPGRDELPDGSVQLYSATLEEINAAVAS